MSKSKKKFGIDGKTLKSCVEWLRKEDEGCCHIKVGETVLHEIDIVVGWHKTEVDDGPGEEIKIGDVVVHAAKYKEEWRIFWKIGQQSFNNGMQTDFDIDFDMPYWPDGTVIDTCTEIVVPEKGRLAWSSLAEEINKTAREVLKAAKEIDKAKSEAA